MDQTTSPDRKSDDTRVRIFETALGLIETVGAEKMTVRKIAEHADVSPALIIQYFGSKGNLLREAFLHQSVTLLDEVEALEQDATKISLSDLMSKFAEIFLKRDLRYPALTREMMIHSITERQINEIEFEDEVRPQVKLIAHLLKTNQPGLSEKQANLCAGTVALCYGNSLRIILMRKYSADEALAFLNLHFSVIALGIEAMAKQD